MFVRKSIIGFIFLLALIGLGSTLFRQPEALFKQLIVWAIIIGSIYVIYRIWISKRPDGQNKRAFLKAARRSKKRMKNRQSSASTQIQALKKPIRKKSQANLTVIEGKKGKKKNRAIY